ncbi:helix-turn-helix transcriptional regulator [Lentzea sp. NPDC004782]|uniref:helix-turn-helix domain-containing protein n=1 Tax=Lentzea sp. NPDC004782 TaxID=3154458 RepID=UPI00339E15D4
MGEEITCAAAFGERLRELRGALTQQAVARRSVSGREALTRQRVSYIENGQLPTEGQLRCYLQGIGRTELVDELDIIRRALQNSPADKPEPRQRWWFVVLAAAVALVSVGTAIAALELNKTSAPVAAIGECAPNYVCFWAEPNFGGQKIQLDPVWYSEPHCEVLPFEARSEMNSSKERQFGFVSKDCTGSHTVLNHLGGSERSISVHSYQHS